MKLRSLLYLTLFAFVIWKSYGYVVVHTSGDVIAYKRFARFLLKNDDYEARRLTAMGSRQPMRAFEFQDKRWKYLLKGEKVFTYYSILSQNVHDGGMRSTLVAEQVTRINPEGYDTLWGERSVRIKQHVEMILEKGSWKVLQFNDSVMIH